LLGTIDAAARLRQVSVLMDGALDFIEKGIVKQL
jgi:hypothetical protein